MFYSMWVSQKKWREKKWNWRDNPKKEKGDHPEN